MKKLLISVVALSFVLYGGTALAFHDGGVAYCAGCHTMHNGVDHSKTDGRLLNPDSATGVANLLNRSNSTDTCLRCHAGYGQFADGNGWGAGGDFYWVTKTWTWNSHGAKTSPGDDHGHNVISPNEGIAMDQTLFFGPGGDYSREHMTCTACHDPHGNQNFRLLYSAGAGEPQPYYGGLGYTFSNPAPQAVGNSRYTNQTSTRGEVEANDSHTVYKSGMSEWCANCHLDLHSDTNPANFVHPVSEDLDELAAVYNAYISTDDLNDADGMSGIQSQAYLGLVPFEDVDADLHADGATSSTMGPAANDQVMCLTCHRSHASPFANAGRWDMNVTFIAESIPGHHEVDDPDNPDQTIIINTGGATDEDLLNKYYGYEFSANQRSLCNKCHMKDLGDAPMGAH